MSSKSTRFIPSVKLSEYDVVNTKGENMGQVKTLVVDMREGLIAFALVVFGGSFLGLGFGDKWFAVPWAALKWHPESWKFILDMPEEVLKNAPGMDKDKWLEEIDKWQEDKDLNLLDRYYTNYGYESYNGIVQRRILKTVNRGANNTTIATSSLNPSIYGQSITFTATVSAVSPETGIPTGRVTFMDGNTTLGLGMLNAAGIATFSTSTLSKGTHGITAVYAGDSNFNGNTSVAVSQTVK